MHRIIDQSHEDKVKMYNLLSKEQLIEMLIECNRIIDSIKPMPYYVQSNQTDRDVINDR